MKNGYFELIDRIVNIIKEIEIGNTSYYVVNDVNNTCHKIVKKELIILF